MTSPTHLHGPSSREAAAPDRERDRPAQGSPATRHGAQAVLAAQRAAGNRAVAGALGGSANGVQRAPNGDDVVPSTGSVTAGEYDDDESPAVPNKGAVTAADDRPASSGPKAPAPRPGPPGGPGAPAGATPIPAGSAGGVPKVESRMWHRAQPTSERDALLTFNRDPTKVIRSPDRHWHWQMWNGSKGTEKYGMKAPMVIRAGSLIIVHPNYQGPATTLPNYRGAGVGLGTPTPPGGPTPGGGAPGGGGSVPGPGGPGAVGAAPAGPGEAAPPAPNRLRQAVAPETPMSGPRGTIKAEPATASDVRAAMLANPNSVVRSPNDRWHRQGYRLDGGGGYPPPAFKVGGLYIISPDYPFKREVPPLSVQETTRPSMIAGIPANQVASPDDDYDDIEIHSPPTKKPAKAEVVRGTASVTTATEQVDVQGGEKRTTTRSTKGSANQTGFGGEYKKRVETVKGDKTEGKETSGGVQVDVLKQPGVNLNVKRAYDTGPAATPDGPKPQVGAQATGGITEKGVTATGGLNRQTASGNQHGATMGGTYNFNGDTSGQIGYQFQSQSGKSASFSIGGGRTVTIDEPVELPSGKWQVQYTITDSTSVSGGASVRTPGGFGIGGQGSVSEGDLTTGTRLFDDERAAERWKKDKARAEVTKEVAPMFPPTTALGALSIPDGQSRGVGRSKTVTGGATVTFGATLGRSGHSTTVGEISVLKVSGVTVHATVTATGTSGSDWSISGGLTNEKGGSETKLIAVTYEFDLGSKQGQEAFEAWCRFPLPPGGGIKQVRWRTLRSNEEHDKYGMLGTTATYKKDQWEDRVEDATGVHQQFGGADSHDVNPGRIFGFLDDEVHSRAEIVASLENGQEAGYQAKFTISGESGSYNRSQFGKIFMGARTDATAKPSGKWTLSAEVPREAVRELERNHEKFRTARTKEDKLRVYAELVKENGARMLGGQVGMESLAWSLELKGDDNFPGAKGRARLNAELQRLSQALRSNPDNPYTIAREAKEILDRLDKRFRAVEDKKKYTDLPDGLRKQQLELIRQHMREFLGVRHRALSMGNRFDPNEKIEDVEKRATSKGGYDKIRASDRERAKVSDDMRLTERAIKQRHDAIWNASKALNHLVSDEGGIKFRPDVDKATMETVTTTSKDDMRAAFELDRQQRQQEREAMLLREKMDKETDPAARLTAMRPVQMKLRERLMTLERQLDHLMSAARAIAPVGSFKAMQRRGKFWQTIVEPREEAQEETRMAL